MNQCRWRWSAIFGVFLSGVFLPDLTCLGEVGTEAILRQVPEDAWAFAIGHSIERLDQRRELLRKQFDTAWPSLARLGAEMMPSGVKLDEKRPIGIVVQDVKRFQDVQQAAVLLVPVSDPAAFIERLACKPLDGGIQTCRLFGGNAFVCVKGGYLALGPSEASMRHFAAAERSAGSQFKGRRAALLEKSDVYVSLMPKAIFGNYGEAVFAAAEGVLWALGTGGRPNAGAMTWLREATALDFAMAMDEKGLQLTAMLVPSDPEGHGDSGGEKATGEGMPSIRWLPNQPIVFAAAGHRFSNASAGSAANQPWGVFSLFGMWLQTNDFGLNQKAIGEATDLLDRLAVKVDGFALSVSPANPGDDGRISAVLVLQTRDPKACVEGLRQCAGLLPGVFDDQRYAEVRAGLVHKAKAETIDGVSVDILSVDLRQSALFMGEESIPEAPSRWYEEIAVRIGIADGARVVVALGGGPERVGEIVKVLRGESPGLDGAAELKSAATKLTSPWSIELFINIDEGLNAVRRIVGEHAIRAALPGVMPKVGEPLALAVAKEEGAWRCDVVFPLKLIMALQSVFQDKSSPKMHDFDEQDEDGIPKAEPPPQPMAPAPEQAADGE